MATEEIELGYVSGVFGTRGEVRLHLHNRDSDLLAAGRDVVLVALDGSRRVAQVKTRSGAGRRVLGRISGVQDRDAAAALKGTRLLIPAETLPILGADEFYVREVIGAPVRAGGARIGEVVEVHATAGGDVLEIRTPSGPVFVPCLRSWVLELAPGGVELHPDAVDPD